jgi:hypothetical protein
MKRLFISPATSDASSADRGAGARDHRGKDGMPSVAQAPFEGVEELGFGRKGAVTASTSTWT